MRSLSGQDILSAKRPSDIFSMNPETLEREKDEYLERFKPKDYCAIENFMIAKKVILLYKEALDDDSDYEEDILEIVDSSGKTHRVRYHYSNDIKLGRMYVSEKNIVFIVDKKQKKYYENYISKVRNLRKVDPKIWVSVKYMVPKLKTNFEADNGDGVIVIEKPHQDVYPLREILDYFGGRLDPRYVASIITKLYYFVCYTGILELQQNAITVNNLFFAPGKRVEEGKECPVESLRIVGVYGGWFFSTWSDEKMQGILKEIKEVLPEELIRMGYSSIKVDLLSIKKLARDLLGNDFKGVPDDFVEWITTDHVEDNPYEEMQAWKQARDKSFGKPKFIEMDLNNID